MARTVTLAFTRESPFRKLLPDLRAAAILPARGIRMCARPHVRRFGRPASITAGWSPDA
jgi:hypothetical protein